MNKLELQAEHVRHLRDQLNTTLAQLEPRLTPERIVDDTFGELSANPKARVLAKAVAVGSVAWLFNTYVKTFIDAKPRR